MDDSQFEGSLVLERLAEIGRLDEFWEAVDADDFDKARLLMESAEIDSETVLMTLKKMKEADGEH